ncbi:MAG: alpha-galactosidase, partial [Clostridia bacterium]|nr:alpha-galactosidase [Clostridia bacterium]
GELSHRYILGVYSLAEYLTQKFPNVFFEGCAGGGGRFDPAILRYFPQIWASDNTDALARAAIQYGTGFCYPLSSMSGHVSACPNHQTGRVTPFKSRRDIASLCATGFELDLNSLTEEDFRAISEHVGFYNAVYDLILEGDLYRIKSPFDGNYFAQTVVSKDKKRAMFVLMKKTALANDVYPVIRLKGLKDDYEYEIQGDVFGGKVYGGDVLCKVGLRFPNDLKDFETVSFTLKAKETD